MNFKVKYHADVPEDIRKKAHEFFYSKALTEELDGIAVPCTDFFNELTKIGFRAIFHDYGYEIIPLPLFIKQELEAYSGEVIIVPIWLTMIAPADDPIRMILSVFRWYSSACSKTNLNA